MSHLDSPFETRPSAAPQDEVMGWRGLTLLPRPEVRSAAKPRRDSERIARSARSGLGDMTAPACQLVFPTLRVGARAPHLTKTRPSRRGLQPLLRTRCETEAPLTHHLVLRCGAQRSLEGRVLVRWRDRVGLTFGCREDARWSRGPTPHLDSPFETRPNGRSSGRGDREACTEPSPRPEVRSAAKPRRASLGPMARPSMTDVWLSRRCKVESESHTAPGLALRDAPHGGTPQDEVMVGRGRRDARYSEA